MRVRAAAGLSGGVPEQGQVGSGDEGAAGAGEDQRAQGRIIDCCGDGLRELLRGFEIEGVEVLGPVEDDSADAVGGVVLHGWLGGIHR